MSDVLRPAHGRITKTGGPRLRFFFALLTVVLAASAARAEDDYSTPVGHWDVDVANLPVFVYTMDEFNDDRALYPTSAGPANDHWHLVGNGRLVALAYNHGEVQLYAGERGSMWLNERDPGRHRYAGGYGFLQDGDTVISLRYPDRPAGCTSERRFGVGYFQKVLTCPDLRLTQTIAAEPGEDTILSSNVEIENLSTRPRSLTWYEYWDVNPHYFGAMVEVAGKEGESEGGGEGLGALSPLIGKLSRVIPGYSLSKLTLKYLRSWRDQLWKGYTVSARAEAPGLLVARVNAPGGPAAAGARMEADDRPPALFLAAFEPTSGFETRRARLFDRQGRFRGRIENGEVADKPSNRSPASLVFASPVSLEARGKAVRHFLVGYAPHGADLANLRKQTMPRQGLPTQWRTALPETGVGPIWLDREMVWHAYYQKAMATYDDYFQSRVISQGCFYQYGLGLNIAARDPLQHLLPMVYLEPGLARDAIRYTLREMDPRGFIPYGVKGVGMRTAGGNPFPSDTELYLMLAATEYVLATRDFAFLDEVLPYYPKEDGKSGTVREHLMLAWRHLIDEVGVGRHGLIKLRNSDWNDSFLAEEAGLDPDLDLGRVEEEAESVLNTALAAYVLPSFAELVRAGGDEAAAAEIEQRAAAFTEALRAQWNGRWFNRALLPGDHLVGGDRLYLSPQPWAILADALDLPGELMLDETLHSQLTVRSPLGAVMRWPPFDRQGASEGRGQGTNGGVWYSLRVPLVMAYARNRPAYAWEEFEKMTLHAHGLAYPDTWIGQWSGPDSYNAPDADQPGRTWTALPFSGGMMDFPVMCGHAHAAPWFSLIKLLGVEPTADGFIIDPHPPAGRKKWSISTELITLRAGPGTMEGELHPVGSEPVTWRVRAPSGQVKIHVNGKPAPVDRDGDFAFFTTAVDQTGVIHWSLTTGD